MTRITSNKNQIFKDVKSLKLRKFRDEKGLFFIEGTRFFEESMTSDIKITGLFLSETFSETEYTKKIFHNDRIKEDLTYILPDKLFGEISDTENPQGLLCVIEKLNRNDEDKILKAPFIIILDSIQDPGNMGTIIRTADAAGVGAIILSKNCVDIYNPKVLRATMGSVFHIPIIQSNDMKVIIDTLKNNGTKVLAAHPAGRKDYFEIDLTGKVAIIIGNEANGISEEVRNIADELLKIPMPGAAESLNASVAAAVIAFERVRQIQESTC